MMKAKQALKTPDAIRAELQAAKAAYDATAETERMVWSEAMKHAEETYEVDLAEHDYIYAERIAEAAARLRAHLQPTLKAHRAAWNKAREKWRLAQLQATRDLKLWKAAEAKRQRKEAAE